MEPTLHIARPMRRAGWTALEGDEVVGSGTGLMRPDRRWFVSIDTWEPRAFDALLDAMRTDLRQGLYVTLNDGSEQLRQWTSRGFGVARREHEYELPTAAAVDNLSDAATPNGVVLVSAGEVDEAELRHLDDALRQEVPGADGWLNDPEEFHDYTFDPRHFDASTYLVAIDETAEAFAGLVRVWMDPGRPRLGLIGVRDGYRRIGLARALLATVFVRLHQRGIDHIAAEADVSNARSNALLTGIGGRRTGGTVELFLNATQP